MASSWLFILLHKSFIVILSGLPSLHRQKKTIIWFFPCPLPNGNQHSGHYWRARQDAEMNGCGVEASWNVMAHAQKPDFVFRRNGRVHLNRRGRQFSRLLAAEVCASAVVMLDTPCSEIVWRVLATHSIRQFPLHFFSRALMCAITFQLESTSGALELLLLQCSPDLRILWAFVFIYVWEGSFPFNKIAKVKFVCKLKAHVTLVYHCVDM